MKGEGRQPNKQDRGEDRLATYAFRHQRYKTDREEIQISQWQLLPRMLMVILLLFSSFRENFGVFLLVYKGNYTRLTFDQYCLCG